MWRRDWPEGRLFGYALLLHFVWELLASPFYMDTYEVALITVLWNRVHCTLGDGLITLGLFWAAALVGGGRQWLQAAGPLPLAVFLVGGLIFTAWSEYWNVQIVRTWAYSPLMPAIARVGLVPLAQWIVLPPLVLRLARPGRRGKRAIRPVG